MKRDIFLISRELIDVNTEKAITPKNVDRDHNDKLDWNELDDYEKSLQESKQVRRCAMYEDLPNVPNP